MIADRSNRVPATTAWFWLIKTMITAADVTWPDYLYGHLGQVPVSGLILIAVVVTLVAQFRARGYRAWTFWPATVAVSVAGTEAANGLHRLAHLSYPVVTLGYLVLLVALLAWWWVRDGAPSPRRIDTARREAFYWAGALLAFALGTAVGHTGLVAPLGRLVPALWIWAALVACVAVAWRWLRLGAAPAFWICYVLTRPLGTSVALLLAGGLGLGQWPVTIGFAAAVLVLVAYLSISRRDVRSDQ